VIGDLRGLRPWRLSVATRRNKRLFYVVTVGGRPAATTSTIEFISATYEEYSPVMVRSAVAMLFSLAFSTIAFAQAQSDMGTPEQRDACGPDVRRFCHKLKESDGQDAYLQCLELNRSKLSAKCIALLQSYGK
jgi:hypothetical protein